MSQAMLDRTATHDLSAELVVAIGRLHRAVARAVPTSVPTASLRLLSQVEELEPVTIGALAASDHCSQPTMSAAVLSLCERGWARKRPNPDDARSSLVTITEAGSAVLAEARQKRAAAVVDLFAADPAHDQHDLAIAVGVLHGLLTSSTSRSGLDRAPMPTHHTEGTA